MLSKRIQRFSHRLCQHSRLTLPPCSFLVCFFQAFAKVDETLAARLADVDKETKQAVAALEAKLAEEGVDDNAKVRFRFGRLRWRWLCRIDSVGFALVSLRARAVRAHSHAHAYAHADAGHADTQPHS